MTQTVRVPFEGSDVALELPSSWRVLAEVAPRPLAALHDVAAAVREALERPIGCEPLADLAGKKIVLAVDDVSRPTPVHRFFPAVLEHLLARGARREDLVVVTALGVHRPMTQAEVERKVGAESLAGLRWVNHDARSPAELVALGTTSRGTEVALNRHLVAADLVVCLGAIEPHLLLGFGGGLKMIVPGLAAERTIAQNHMQGVTPERFNYVGSVESPMRLDLEEAARMLRARLFAVNTVLNERLEPCRFVCGEPVAAHRAGVETVRGLAGREVHELADVAIVGSSPMNADLRQGMKCIGNVEKSVKEGGLVLGLLECAHGIGDLAVPPRTLPHGVLRGVLRLLGRDRVLWFVDKVKRGAAVEERFLAHFSMQIARKNELFVWSRALPRDTGRRLGIFRQFDDLGAMVAEAARRVPRNATVLVYPYGGATYPIVEGAP